MNLHLSGISQFRKQLLILVLAFVSVPSCGPVENLRNIGKKRTEKVPEKSTPTVSDNVPDSELSAKKKDLRKVAEAVLAASESSAAGVNCSENQQHFNEYTQGSRAAGSLAFNRCLDNLKDVAASESCVVALQTDLDKQLVLARKIFGC